MSKQAITNNAEDYMQDAIDLLKNHGIRMLPVMKSGKLVGIVTDRPGSIKQITDVIRSYGGQLASILTAYENPPPGYRNLYVRAYQIDREKLPALQRILKEKTKILYMVDHRESTRTVYY